MFTMKKFIFVLIALIFLMPQNKITFANVRYDYAMISNDSAPFYADSSLSIVKFNLPKTYFVKVVEIFTDYSRVIYMNSNENLPKVEGYVENINLEFVSFTPDSPSPKTCLTLNSDEVLFSDLLNLTPKTVLSVNSLAYYYGEITFSGESYVYVYSQGYVGYARKSAFNQFTIPHHKDYVEPTIDTSSNNQTSVSVNENQNPSSASTISTEQVIVIALILLTIVFVIFLFFKPNDKKVMQEAFFNDDD